MDRTTGIYCQVITVCVVENIFATAEITQLTDCISTTAEISVVQPDGSRNIQTADFAMHENLMSKDHSMQMHIGGELSKHFQVGTTHLPPDTNKRTCLITTPQVTPIHDLTTAGYLKDVIRDSMISKTKNAVKIPQIKVLRTLGFVDGLRIHQNGTHQMTLSTGTYREAVLTATITHSFTTHISNRVKSRVQRSVRSCVQERSLKVIPCTLLAADGEHQR
jgi:hypothetical protein